MIMNASLLMMVVRLKCSVWSWHLVSRQQRVAIVLVEIIIVTQSSTDSLT